MYPAMTIARMQQVIPGVSAKLGVKLSAPNSALVPYLLFACGVVLLLCAVSELLVTRMRTVAWVALGALLAQWTYYGPTLHTAIWGDSYFEVPGTDLSLGVTAHQWAFLGAFHLYLAWCLRNEKSA